MSKLPQKPGLGAGKTAGNAKGAGAGNAAKGNDPKHLPR